LKGNELRVQLRSYSLLRWDKVAGVSLTDEVLLIFSPVQLRLKGNGLHVQLRSYSLLKWEKVAGVSLTDEVLLIFSPVQLRLKGNGLHVQLHPWNHTRAHCRSDSQIFCNTRTRP